jgi:hypothetical protein
VSLNYFYFLSWEKFLEDRAYALEVLQEKHKRILNAWREQIRKFSEIYNGHIQKLKQTFDASKNKGAWYEYLKEHGLFSGHMSFFFLLFVPFRFTIFCVNNLCLNVH